MLFKETNRDDSDAGLTADLQRVPWTVEEVQQRALNLGKLFNPNPEIADRLKSDLANGQVVVLFTADDVRFAISAGAVPKEYEDDLVNLVSQQGLNDIAVVPAVSANAEQNQKLNTWFLSNSRC